MLAARRTSKERRAYLQRTTSFRLGEDLERGRTAAASSGSPRPYLSGGKCCQVSHSVPSKSRVRMLHCCIVFGFQPSSLDSVCSNSLVALHGRLPACVAHCPTRCRRSPQIAAYRLPGAAVAYHRVSPAHRTDRDDDLCASRDSRTRPQ